VFATRFAPSPTGYLHRGHAFSALSAHAAACEAGGRFVLRIEDIDATRCRPEFEAAIYDDLAWFGHDGHPPAPKSLADLAKPAYRKLLVTENPASSSPGLAFMLATIDAFGEDGWQDYWQKLRDNDVRVDDGWEQAYEADFTAGGGSGDRPLVVDHVDRRLHLLAGEAASGLLDVRVLGGQRGFELGVVEVEELSWAVLLGDPVPILLDRRLLKLRVTVEAERLGEADNRR